MAVISQIEARGMFTTALAAKYKERPIVFSFLRSLFPSKEFATKQISIEVSRGSEKVAPDVLRGTEGVRVQSTKSTGKTFVPPYYKLFFDALELDSYDRLFASENIEASAIAGFVDDVAERLGMMQDMIERRYELQCAQVLETGIVTLVNGDNIDFKRKATSLVDNSATTWANNANNPLTHLEAGANFLRKVGKVQGGTIDVILGSSALNAFLANENVMKRADVRNYSLDNISSPLKNGVGSVLHGNVAAGAYSFNLWSYPEFHENNNGVMTSYVNEKKVIMLPEKTNFNLMFGAVPQLYKGKDNGTVNKGAFVFGEYTDEGEEAHKFNIKSAGVAVPVAVDQIYTTQVLV